MKQADGGCPGLSVVSIHLVVRFSQWMPSCFGYSQKTSWFSLHHFSWRAQKYPCHILKYQRNQLLLHFYMTLDTNLAMERCRLCVNWQHQGSEFFYHQGSVSVSKSVIFCNYNGLALYMSHIGERWGSREEKRGGGKSMRMKGLCYHFHLYISWQFILIWLAPIPANNFSSDQHHWAFRW